MHTSWKKVKRMYLLSTDTVFTINMINKSLQTKGQKPADREIFERHVQL